MPFIQQYVWYTQIVDQTSVPLITAYHKQVADNELEVMEGK